MSIRIRLGTISKCEPNVAKKIFNVQRVFKDLKLVYLKLSEWYFYHMNSPFADQCFYNFHKKNKFKK